MADAGLDTKSINNDRFGCIVGSGIGGVEWFENNCNAFTAAGGGYNSLRTVDPFLIPALISNTASGMIAIEHNAKGPNYCVTTACASGTHSIGAALKHMRDGEADIMIAGGSEAALTPLCFAGFVALTAMVSKYNDQPTKVRSAPPCLSLSVSMCICMYIYICVSQSFILLLVSSSASSPSPPPSPGLEAVRQGQGRIRHGRGCVAIAHHTLLATCNTHTHTNTHKHKHPNPLTLSHPISNTLSPTPSPPTPQAPASSCWRRRSTHWPGGRASTASWQATAAAATPTTSRRRPRGGRASPGV